MTPYRPSSPLLQQMIADDELPKGAEADLIALTQDGDAANRDWALFVLAQSDLDTPAVRAALTAGLDDPLHEARLEALIGLARRDPAGTLPLVAKALESETIDSMALEAAAEIGEPALLPALEAIRADIEPGDALFDDALAEAIRQCTV
jgi:hypothetical protein